jgi:hypothetical protein
MKQVKNFDDLMLQLAMELDFKTGESLYGLQQIDQVDAEHKLKQNEFIKQQLLLQGFMDIKSRLPHKVYDEIVMKIAKTQDEEGTVVAKSQDDERPQESKEDIEKMVKVSDRFVMLGI